MEPNRDQHIKNAIQNQFMKDWDLLVITEGKSSKHGRWQGIAFLGKTREGQSLFAGCQSARNRNITITKASAIREAVLMAYSLGFRKLIVLTSDNSMERLGETHSKYKWQLTPILEDIKYLQLHHNLQLHIKAAPNLILQEVSSMATKAANFFANVMHVASNVSL
jgi:hypothetical protein